VLVCCEFSGRVASPQEANKHRRADPHRAGTSLQPQLQADVGGDRTSRRRATDGKGSRPRLVLQSAAEGKADQPAVGDGSRTVLCDDSAPTDHAHHDGSQWEESGVCQSAWGGMHGIGIQHEDRNDD